MTLSDVDVRHNEQASRFEAHVDGLTAVAEYEQMGDQRVFVHTKVPESLEGQGLGEHLVRAALDATIADGLGIFPVCPFVEHVIEEHPEYKKHVQMA